MSKRVGNSTDEKENTDDKIYSLLEEKMGFEKAWENIKVDCWHRMGRMARKRQHLFVTNYLSMERNSNLNKYDRYLGVAFHLEFTTYPSYAISLL